MAWTARRIRINGYRMNGACGNVAIAIVDWGMIMQNNADYGMVFDKINGLRFVPRDEVSISYHGASLNAAGTRDMLSALSTARIMATISGEKPTGMETIDGDILITGGYRPVRITNIPQELQNK